MVDFLGVRHDGGDAETGFSADIGGGVTLAAPAEGLTVSLEGRGVRTHEAAGLRDRGFSGTLAWDPPPSTGRGPKLTLSQSLGARGVGRQGRAACRGPPWRGLAANDNGDGRRRLEATFGYGFSAFGDRFTSAPEIGLGLSDAGRDCSLGWRLTRAGSRALPQHRGPRPAARRWICEGGHSAASPIDLEGPRGDRSLDPAPSAGHRRRSRKQSSYGSPGRAMR